MTQNELEFVTRMLVVPGLLIVAGAAVMVATIFRNGKLAEHRHRERMAMIERGLTPPEPVESREAPRRAVRVRMTMGIVLCGFGAALFMLIGFAAGELGVATGVGGGFVMIGLAFIASAVVARDEPASPSAPSSVPPPAI